LSNAPTLPLVLLPGLMCDAAVWQPQIQALARAAQCTVADHGALDDLGGMAQAVLQAAPQRFALAGHSMGGRVALEVVRRAPERVARLALLDTGMHALPTGAAGTAEVEGRMRLVDTARRQGVRAMARQWVRGMVHPDRLADRALIDTILDMFERNSADVFAAQIQALIGRPEAEDVLRACKLPTLLLTGANDSWSPPAAHEEMARCVPGSRLLIVQGSGHMVTLEHPTAVSDALLAWLQA
jgi:pimeloyl-ACP methyl ester carboxylesterase